MTTLLASTARSAPRIQSGCAASIGVLLALTGSRAAGLDVAFDVREPAGAERKPGIVSSGVPFARGAVRDLGRLSVRAGHTVLPAQFVKLAPWDDGSVRWALLDCQAGVPARETVKLTIRDDGANKPPAQPVKVTESAGNVTVSTGPLSFVIDNTKPGLFRSLKVDGKELIDGSGRGLVIWADCEPQGTVRRSGRPAVMVPKYGPGKPFAALPPASVETEQAGPMKAIVTLRGKFPEKVHKGLAAYTVRIYAYAGQKHLKLHAWLQNEGAHGYTWEKNKTKVQREWMIFDGMALELGLSLGDVVRASCEGVSGDGSFRVHQYVTKPKKDRGPAYRLEDFVYTIKKGEEELKKGLRTDGIVSLAGGNGKLTVAVRDFWENYEKAIELDGQKLRLWLWPLEGQWPRRWNGYSVAQYACHMMATVSPVGVYGMPGGVHKGHQVILDFSGRNPAQAHAALDKPLFAVAPAAYYAGTEAVPGLFAPPAVRVDDDECDPKLDAWMRMTRSAFDPKSEHGIWEARRRQGRLNFWYGWLEFGDMCIPGNGYVSLHYDWPWIMLVNLLRTGDLNALRLAEDMMQHRIDVDHCWSKRELSGYQDLQRPRGAYTHFHCERFTRAQPNVDSNWLPGVVLWYLLSGEPKAREMAERNSAALVRGWEGLTKSGGWGAGRRKSDMQSNARAMFGFCSMYALTADRGWLDKALNLFRTHVTGKWKSVGPHLHDRQQIRSQEYTRDDIKYCYSIQAFCLLHHYTKDEKLFELLKAGCDKEFPENFFDAPLFLADLNAYVALVSGEEDYADAAVEHWIAGFPESKCPPVYSPRNSQWSRRKAMFLRTGHLLQYSFWKKGKP